jgi:hypothetical protein
MRLYKYDSSTLEFKKVNYLLLVLKILTPFFIVILFSSTILPEKETVNITPEERVLIISEASKFTKEKLIREIERLNFRFPHIVLAQAQIESGNFSSPIFKENHNMFGMREAQVRANLARGTRRKHAFYDTWKESLYDYALYYSTYLSKLKTEDQYFDYLGQSYAEDPNYVKKVKIQSNINKKLFN